MSWPWHVPSDEVFPRTPDNEVSSQYSESLGLALDADDAKRKFRVGRVILESHSRVQKGRHIEEKGTYQSPRQHNTIF